MMVSALHPGRAEVRLTRAAGLADTSNDASSESLALKLWGLSLAWPQHAGFINQCINALDVSKAAAPANVSRARQPTSSATATALANAPQCAEAPKSTPATVEPVNDSQPATSLHTLSALQGTNIFTFGQFANAFAPCHAAKVSYSYLPANTNQALGEDHTRVESLSDGVGVPATRQTSAVLTGRGSVKTSIAIASEDDQESQEGNTEDDSGLEEDPNRVSPNGTACKLPVRF